MAFRRNGAVLQQVRVLFGAGALGLLTDAELLERFLGRRGETAEAAFAALVARHGPMVLRVCRAVLRDPHEADDAFQATFLVLVRKARSIRDRDALGPWLHGVAFRVARCARSATTRRRGHERRRAEMTAPGAPGAPDQIDLAPAVHEEVHRLPARYRSAIVLCDLQGQTYEEAARGLGWPVGTLKSRLARGRAHLRARLAGRGLAPAVGGVALWMAADTADAAVPPALADATIQAAMQFAAGPAATAGAVPATVVALTERVLTIMQWTKWKITATVAVVAVGVAATGAGVLAQGDPNGPRSENSAVGKAADPSENDRLGEVERKLDRVLRALEGSHHGEATKAANPPAAYYPPAPAGAGSAPTPAPPGGGPGGGPSREAGKAGYPAAPGAYGGMMMPQAQPPGAAEAFDRLSRVEQRLNDLERRLQTLERRLDRRNAPQGERLPEFPAEKRADSGPQGEDPGRPRLR